MNNTFRLAILGGAVMLTAVGCGRLTDRAVETVSEQAIEATIESETNADVDVDISDDSYTIKTEDGSLSASGNEDDGSFTIETDEVSVTGGTATELPSEWPEDVPLVDGFTVTTTVNQGDDIQTVGVEVDGGDSAALFDEMIALLEENGWTESARISSGSLYGYTAQKDDRSVSVSINDEPDSDNVIGAISVGTGL